MDQGSNDIRQNIEQTRSSLDDKLNMLEDKANVTSEKVKQAIDIRGQVAERPWTALGVAVAAGFVLGSLGNDEPDYDRYNQRWGNQPASTPVNYGTTSSGGSTGSSTGPSTTDKIMEKGSDFLSQFDDEINMLKGAAVSAVTAFIRDSVREYSPKLGNLLDEQMRQRGLPVGSSSGISGAAYNSSGSGSARSYDSSPTGLSSSGRNVSSASTESFHARSEMPNADYDDMGQFNRVGMAPQNNPSDSEYYETYTPETSSNQPEPPASQPRQMDKQARNETTNYAQ